MFSECLLWLTHQWQEPSSEYRAISGSALHLGLGLLILASLANTPAMKAQIYLRVGVANFPKSFSQGATWETGTAVEGCTNKLNSMLLNIIWFYL